MKKDVFKIDDDIEIMNPLFVKRVGYALHPLDLYESIASDQKVLEAMKLMGIHPEQRVEVDWMRWAWLFKPIVPSELVQTIAFIKTRQLGFGGNVRSLHYETKDLSKLKGSIFRVRDKKFVKTGERVAPFTSYSYDGEPEYEPGYLTNEKTHILLQIRNSNHDYWIEEINVKRPRI